MWLLCVREVLIRLEVFEAIACGAFVLDYIILHQFHIIKYILPGLCVYLQLLTEFAGHLFLSCLGVLFGRRCNVKCVHVSITLMLVIPVWWVHQTGTRPQCFDRCSNTLLWLSRVSSWSLVLLKVDTESWLTGSMWKFYCIYSATLLFTLSKCHYFP